jgi:hypothetical protein
VWGVRTGRVDWDLWFVFGFFGMGCPFLQLIPFNISPLNGVLIAHVL